MKFERVSVWDSKTTMKVSRRQSKLASSALYQSFIAQPLFPPSKSLAEFQILIPL
jgi:hypothetical protein